VSKIKDLKEMRNIINENIYLHYLFFFTFLGGWVWLLVKIKFDLVINILFFFMVLMNLVLIFKYKTHRDDLDDYLLFNSLKHLEMVKKDKKE
jgi:ABC-type Mn2+/Zn2+ transport system permease subunit